jgi:hypothetical protein
MRARVAFALAAIGLLGARCGGDDPVPALEAEKQALLASSVPKAEFWAEVERKGKAVKQEKAAEAELTALAARELELDPRIAQTSAALADARRVNGEADEVLRKARAESERLTAECAKREAKLRDFAARRKSEAG